MTKSGMSDLFFTIEMFFTIFFILKILGIYEYESLQFYQNN